MDAISFLRPEQASWLQNSDLTSHISKYWQDLIDKRYTINTARGYLCCTAHFSRWMNQCCLSTVELTDEVINEFLDRHLPVCTCPNRVQRGRQNVRAALRFLLVSLSSSGALPIRLATDSVTVELQRFDDHMLSTRGLALSTRLERTRMLEPFLRKYCQSKSDTLTSIRPQDLRTFICERFEHLRPVSAGSLAIALRGYLRYRAICGDQVEQLLPIIASPAHWRLGPLPQTLSPSQVDNLLDSFPAELPSRLRGYAIVRCVVDLGLRANEVINIELDDIDWSAGTLRIGRNKSRRVQVLPLPQLTGEAIAKYLHSERPQTCSRHVFVRHVAPVDIAIKSDVVRNTIRAAFLRCGITNTRVYAIRHTLASRLLSEGATLKEVADVLRHQSLDTTLIYAKVDRTRLSAVVMPWPGSTS